MAVGGTYAPSLSLRRRFGPAPPPPQVREIVTDTRQTPVAELCVHEYDAPVATVESPPSSQEDVAEMTDRRVSNEIEKVEDVAVLHEYARYGTRAANTPAADAESGDGTPQAEFLIQRDEFLESLVQRVRASCVNVMGSGGEAEGPKRDEGATGWDAHRSPPPRRPSPTCATSPSLLEKRRERDDAEEAAPRARAPSRSRSRSPSRLSSPSLSQKGFAAEGRGCGGGVSGKPASPSQCPAALRSRETSPDARAPSTDFFAVGGALRTSLLHSRCSGVSRGRRSVSGERPEVVDETGVGVLESEEEDAFWFHAGAVTGQRAKSFGSAQHPQWVPRPVPQSRPAWNQRQPPKKQRPLVSAPDTKPPPSSRRSTSRSPERARVPSSQLASTYRALTPTRGPVHSVERAFHRSATLPGAQRRSQAPSHERFSATAPRPAAAAATVPARKSPMEEAQVMTLQSPIGGVNTTNSPLSPPSARALFQSIDVDSAARSSPRSATPTSAAHQQKVGSTHRHSPPTTQTLQQTCDAALERATRAEQQCNVLTLALEQLLVEHVAEKAEWQARLASLEQQLSKVTQWVSSIDAEANLSAEETRTSSPATQQADGATENNAIHEVRDVESARPPLPAPIMTSKTAVWEGEEGEVSSHRCSSSTAGRSTDASPLPGAPGATPTPARRDSAGIESRGASACLVRLPPSPPMILHLHAEK
ncbi:hypothetical protein ABL78_0977 [Leptomonas seymouri]|uniref:Uncharacterized protein n=1 Tax=Leptomonas seymouri TaxID=5684 RepID=A0A0N1I823_LEPSE|nr:hypothetical protein ABL78_0977 [Leptomonas seymouri]|eukprot:KPI89905.1 hypothetical protein ABL78_0977 [Leptomonas seymouri]